MNYSDKILGDIKKFSKTPGRNPISNSYHGNNHYNYLLRTPQQRQIAKEFAKNHKDSTSEELSQTLTSLFEGKSFEEKSIAAKILEYMPLQRKQLDPTLLDLWLNHLEGWAEIDSLCQSNFKAQELLNNWSVWEKLIKQFSENTNIVKRRASLVLLTQPVGQSDDKKLSTLAFENIKKLQHERDILITKAVSWLLRSLVRYHKDDVKAYVNENVDKLPKIAIRETKTKLETGKK